MIKPATAGAFVFCRFPDGEWRLGLIKHPRLGRWMTPGGHVEDDECQAQAAVREVAEETGLADVRLLEMPAPTLPAGFPGSHARVPLPWWIIQQPVSADNHLREPHVHVDHQYVAVVEDPHPARAAVHPFAWYTLDQTGELSMFEDTRLLAKLLFCHIDVLSQDRSDVAETLRSLRTRCGSSAASWSNSVAARRCMCHCSGVHRVPSRRSARSMALRTSSRRGPTCQPSATATPGAAVAAR